MSGQIEDSERCAILTETHTRAKEYANSSREKDRVQNDLNYGAMDTQEKRVGGRSKEKVAEEDGFKWKQTNRKNAKQYRVTTISN